MPRTTKKPSQSQEDDGQKRQARCKRQARGRAKPARRVLVLVATRKGAWLYHGDAARKTWRADGPHFLGHIVNHLVLDPRDGRTLLAAAKTGHLGPTVFRSTDFGRSWKEAARPPAFPRRRTARRAAPSITPSGSRPATASEPNVWYAGTSPQGLFRSDDGGINWEPFSSINDDPQYRIWMGSVQDGTPDGPKMHSIIVDPRDPAISISPCRAAACMNRSIAAGPGRPWCKGSKSSEGSMRPISPFTIRIACGSARAIPTGCISRITAASTGSTGRRTNGCGSARRCPSGSATSAFPWWCIRATTTPPGCFRWTA